MTYFLSLLRAVRGANGQAGRWRREGGTKVAVDADTGVLVGIAAVRAGVSYAIDVDVLEPYADVTVAPIKEVSGATY